MVIKHKYMKKDKTKAGTDGKEMFVPKKGYNWLSGLTDGPIRASNSVVYNTLVNAKT